MRIALWNTAFLGDAILTLPLLQSLRLRYPEAEIDFYVRGGLETLFKAHPALTHVYSYEKRGKDKGPLALLSLQRTLVSRTYDLWIGAHTSFRSALAAYASKALRRIGYKETCMASFVYTDTVSRGFGKEHEIQRLLALLQPLGAGGIEEWPNLVLPKEDVDAAGIFFSNLGKPVLGIHPGSVWGTKRWPARYFADIAMRALKKGAHVVLFSGKDELDTSKEVSDIVLGSASAETFLHFHDCSGSLSLPRFAAYLGKLDCFLSNDSGPMHLAWVQHIPTVALFGPTVPSFGFAPQGENATLMEVDLPCRPCGKHGPQVCPLGHHNCMEKLLPDMVWERVKSFL